MSAALALTYADITALGVLAVVVFWLFRSEPPRVLLRALRSEATRRPVNMEDI